MLYDCLSLYLWHCWCFVTVLFLVLILRSDKNTPRTMEINSSVFSEKVIFVVEGCRVIYVVEGCRVIFVAEGCRVIFVVEDRRVIFSKRF